MQANDALRELTEHAGVVASFWDGTGVYRETPDDIVVAALAQLGYAIDHPDGAAEALAAARRQAWSAVAPPCAVAWGEAPAVVELRVPSGAGGDVEGALTLEDGQTRPIAAALEHLEVARRSADGGHVVRRLELGSLPHGYHRLVVRAGGAVGETTIVCAPQRAWGAPGELGRQWAVFAPVYSLWRKQRAGVGHLGDLAEIAGWVGDLGGRFVGTLPLFASYTDELFAPSPYQPVSRLFWNELFLDPAAAPGARGEPPGGAGAPGLVDYRAEASARRAALEPLAARAWETPALAAELDAFAARGHVADYARFRAATERRRQPWTQWQGPARDGELAPGDYDEAIFRFHVYVQYALERQLAAFGATGRAELYLDLPVGVHRDGYDTWRERDAFAMETSVGAPPDALFTGGQNWGLPPLHPEHVRAGGYPYFRDCLRALMSHAGMLRVDHVMGLHRLYWIPRGAAATQGVYVHYEPEELYAVVCLESHRNRCAVAGEDLGTVPDEVRPMMTAHGIARLYVAQFSLTGDPDAPLVPPPHDAVASLNTHDLPTFRGFCEHTDTADMVDLGYLDEAQAQHNRDERARALEATRAYFDTTTPGETMRAVTRHLAASDAEMVQIAVDDLWLARDPHNVPGTTDERPNWRRRAARPLEEILDDHELDGFLGEVDRLRKR